MEPEAALRAIAHPTRRAIVLLVRDAERSSSELADALDTTRPAMSQHLKVLREADLIESRVDGTRRWYRVRRDSLDDLQAFLDDFWAGKLDALRTSVETGK